MTDPAQAGGARWQLFENALTLTKMAAYVPDTFASELQGRAARSLWLAMPRYVRKAWAAEYRRAGGEQP